MALRYDVLVVGAGMVGAAAGCALGGEGVKVAVFDPILPPVFSSEQPPDLRVSALSPATQRFLADIDVWPLIEAMRLCPYRRMAVWEKLESPLTGQELHKRHNQTLFDSRDLSMQQLGFIVENRVTQLAAHQVLETLPSVSLYCPAIVESFVCNSSGVTLMLHDGRTFEADLLIGADGADSLVRRHAGIGLNSMGYEQQALVATVETEPGQLDITWQAFTSTGPLALLPLPDIDGRSYASIVWYNLPEQIQALKALPDEDFLWKMKQTFPAELPKILRLVAKSSFPLTRRHARQYVKPGLALLGDAAHTINPLAGQGVNLGFQDVATLARLVTTAYANGEPLNDIQLLKIYEGIRRPANQRMQRIMDAFYYTFSNDHIPLKVLRNLGLSLAGRFTLGKKQVMKYAMGL